MKYDLIYNVCHWVGNPRPNFLLKHIKMLKELKHSKNKIKILCIFSIMVDDFVKFDKTKYMDLSKYSNDDVIFLVKFYPNWYGSIGSMWLNWQYFIKPLNIKTKYYASYEDDYLLIKEYWFDIVEKIIDKEDLSYLGIITMSDSNKKYLKIDKCIIDNTTYNLSVKFNNDIKVKKELMKKIKNRKRVICRPQDTYHKFEDMRWVDGGAYILMKSSFFDQYYEKCGKFIDKDYNKVFEYNDYISIGEVGFHTNSYLAGIKFKGVCVDGSNDFVKLLDVGQKLSVTKKI